MSSSMDETTPLLQSSDENETRKSVDLADTYQQFCNLIGSKPVDHPTDQPYLPPGDTLYRRALHHRRMQGFTYQFTAALTNTLLLSQIVLGAALTALGASQSSPALITVFGVLNTVIAGLIAFLKSRGQPMRARMFRDDLDRVVDEIENSATMWLGISRGVHGYDEIDTENSVTVRSELARLTRLYDRAVKTNTMNNPDFYGAGSPGDMHSAALRSRPGQPNTTTIVPNPLPGGVGDTAVQASAPTAGPTADPDESPATKAPTPPRASSPVAKTPAETPTSPSDETPKADSGDTKLTNDTTVAPRTKDSLQDSKLHNNITPEPSKAKAEESSA